MSKKINMLREKIDLLDKKIVELLKKRTNLAKEVIALKKELNIGVEDTLREKAIIGQLCKIEPEMSELIKDIYRRVFNWTKSR
ncbi:MAG: chorismate mutase [bacterium]